MMRECLASILLKVNLETDEVQLLQSEIANNTDHGRSSNPDAVSGRSGESNLENPT
jgi:hypothetical protein